MRLKSHGRAIVDPYSSIYGEVVWDTRRLSFSGRHFYLCYRMTLCNTSFAAIIHNTLSFVSYNLYGTIAGIGRNHLTFSLFGRSATA